MGYLTPLWQKRMVHALDPLNQLGNGFMFLSKVVVSLTAVGTTRCIGTSLALLFLSTVQSAASADMVVFANSTSNLGNGPSSQQASSGTVSDTAGGVLGTDTTVGRSSATFGQLRAYAFVQDGTGGTSNGTFAFNTVFFRDDFLFTAEGLTGTAGTVEIKFTVDGSLSASRSANTEAYISGADDSVRAFAEYRFSPGGNQADYVKSEGMRTAQYAVGVGLSQQEGTPFLGIEQTYTVPFTFGTTLEGVGLRLFTGAQGAGAASLNGFSSTAMADLEHTANWGGFGAVRDANGNLLTDYGFTSGSGFNYVQGITAVPEPSSCALLATGVVFCALRRSRALARLRKRISSST